MRRKHTACVPEETDTSLLQSSAQCSHTNPLVLREDYLKKKGLCICVSVTVKFASRK